MGELYVFLRGIAYYDVVLNDHDVGDRSLITDEAIGEVGRNAKLLDAFISANYAIADMPVNLRVGKQVINWGESTFILNGLNNFNPIDVGAFRRPGSEIKEALLPLNAIYGSVTLPEELLNISLAGYYALAWDRYHLDQAGTPFAGSDVATFGSGLGGNEGAASFLSGGLRAGYKLNCGVGLAQTPGGLTTARLLSLIPGTSGTYFTQIAGTNDLPGVTRPNCTQGATNTFNYATNNAFGAAEFERFRRRDVIIADGLAASASAYEGIVDRVDDVYADETGDFGLNAKYLHEGEGWLNGFEFGAYYQNYSSRLPFVDLTTGQFQVGVGTVGNSANIAGEVNSATVASSLASRYAGPAGCTNPALR